MMTDQESNNLIGAGEHATYNILKQLTLLKPQSLKDFKKGKNGIYKQVPLQWVIHKHDFEMLSKEHQQGSIDLFLILNQKRVAVRVQGLGHGQGAKHHGRYSLKGIGKAKHDKVQELLIKKYCSLVDILFRECPNVFKERVTNDATNEIINSFKTSNVMIPVSQEKP